MPSAFVWLLEVTLALRLHTSITCLNKFIHTHSRHDTSVVKTHIYYTSLTYNAKASNL